MFWNTNKTILIPFVLVTTFLFFLPQKARAFFTKEVFINSNLISAGYWEEYDFTTPLKAGESVGKLWLAGNFNVLYDNLAKDLSGIYTKEEFVNALKDSKIAGFEIVGDTVYTNSAQAYVVMKIRYADNSSREYKTVFNYEDGSWKLLGTKEV
ncbi:MAG: hypothetical protein ABIJ36_00570 [Patescibacteria group bacterium]|nr:hypothetical protein [Patescibacteria group bacterium]